MREVWRVVADLLLITKFKEAKRANFPWNMLVQVVLTQEQVLYGDDFLNAQDVLDNTELFEVNTRAIDVSK